LDVAFANQIEFGGRLRGRVPEGHLFLIRQRNRDDLIEDRLQLQRLAVGDREALRKSG
jgi:hypothetical protein